MYEGANSTENFNIYEWFVGYVPMKDLLKIDSLHSRKAWKKWLDEEIDTEVRGPGYIKTLVRDWKFEPFWENDKEPIIVTYNDGRVNIEDGWHRSAIAIVRGESEIPALIGIKHESKENPRRNPAPGIDGWYERTIGGHRQRKIMIGLPRTSNPHEALARRLASGRG